MSDSQNAAPLSVEDIVEAWLDVPLDRFDSIDQWSAKHAAARVLALVQPHIDRHCQRAERAEQQYEKDGRQLAATSIERDGLRAENDALRARVAELETVLADRAPDTDRTSIPQATPKTYFIQDTRQYVGNSVLWWRIDGHGYTCELSEAWEVSEEKARSIERGRETDKAWPATVVRAAASVHVDIQKLRSVVVS